MKISSIIKFAILPLILIVNFLTRKKPYHKVLYGFSMAYLVGDIIYTFSQLFAAKKTDTNE
mgnify:CR=1 FL=1